MGGESIAAPWGRDDQTLVRIRRHERATENEYGLGEVVFLDAPVSPYAPQQFVFRHHEAGVLHEMQEGVEHRRGDVDDGSLMGEFAPDGVQSEPVEDVTSSGPYGTVHLPASTEFRQQQVRSDFPK